MNRIYSSLLLLSILCGAGVPCIAQNSSEAAVVVAANARFRSIYSDAKKGIIAGLGPVIVAAGNDLVLVRNGQREVRNTIAPEYTLLKTVDHIPLATFVLLNDAVEKPVSTGVKNALQNLREATKEVLASLFEAKLPEKAKNRLERMLRESQDFQERVLQSGVSRGELERFIKQQKADAMDNVYDATALELAAIDEQVQKWRAQLPAEEWAQLRVVVAGGHMPRDRERRMQYFGALLGEKREGHRLIFLEGSSDVDQALDLLATHILDEQISRQYFGDDWRMHRDLLSDAAARYLRLHPPEKRKGKVLP